MRILGKRRKVALLVPSPGLVVHLDQGARYSPSIPPSRVSVLRVEPSRPTRSLGRAEMASSAWEADQQQAEWYTRQIATFAQQKQLQKAVDTYQQLVDAGLKPTSYTFSALINAYVLAGDVSGGERVMSEMRAAGCVPNVVTYTTLLKGHCAVGDLDAASALLLQMTTSTPPVKADLRACNTFLRGARRHTCIHIAPRHAHTPSPPRQAASAWAICVRRVGSGACCQAGAWCLTTWPASTRHASARRASSSASCARCCATYRRPATLTTRSP
jgi:pentatricopeptide repeat protein